LKSKSTRFENEEKDLKVNSKFKTFLDLRKNKKCKNLNSKLFFNFFSGLVFVETQSMLQISDNNLSQLVVKSQNSYNSLTSLEGLYYRNSLEVDFEDEELSLEYRTLDYIGQVIQ